MSEYSGIHSSLAASQSVAGSSPAARPDHAVERCSGEQCWDDLFAQAGLQRLPSEYELSGWAVMDGDPSRRMCPPYFNLGMLAARADVMRTLGNVVLDELVQVTRTVESGFRCQLAVMLALARCDVSSTSLPVRWNFPNDMAFWNHYPHDAADIRIFHYLRNDQVDREQGLVGTRGVDGMLARNDLSPVNQVLQARVRELRKNLGSRIGLA